MTTTKRRTRTARTARKLVLPLIAVGMMTFMMYIESTNRSPGFGKNAAYGSVTLRSAR